MLILAAGASSRMGTSKQLLQIDNQSLLQKTIAIALEILPASCIVVLGANLEEHRKEIKNLPIDIVNNSKWEKGMGSSIKVGIQNLKSYKVDAFYILVCDQPLLTSNHLKNLADRYEKSNAPITASSYKTTIGVPALFDWSMSSELLALPDTKGAKELILEKCNQVVEFKGGEIDLDTKEDYLNYIKKSL